jgi:glucan 1,3-beta-glucosidase
MLTTILSAWKTQRNATSGLPYNPLWCYSCGLEYGYVPADPAAARGACPRLANEYGTGGYGNVVSLTTPLAASMTGGTATTSIIAASQISQYGAWPPPSLTNLPGSNLPVYTTTGSEPAYPTTVVSPLSVIATGTPTASDWYTAIAGCSYLNPYSGLGASVPNSRCTGNGAAAATSSNAGGGISSSRATAGGSISSSRATTGGGSNSSRVTATASATAVPTGTA